MRDHRIWKQVGWAVGMCAVATATLIGPAAAQDLSLLTSPNPATRAAAACDLGRIGVRAAIPQLLRLLEDGTPLPRQIFCGTQPPFEDESWAPNYGEVLEPSPGEAAARALIALRADAVTPLKETLVGAAHWRARKNAAWALAHLGGARTELIAALKDPAWQVRTEAAYALFESGGNSREVIDALSFALLDNVWQVREQAAFALGHKADRQAWRALFDVLRDDDERVRAAAANALGNRAGDPEVQFLIAMRRDPDPRVGAGVREALNVVDQRMRGTQTNLTRIEIPKD